jgi:hypothetical protein
MIAPQHNPIPIPRLMREPPRLDLVNPSARDGVVFGFGAALFIFGFLY